jgi:agmatine deiminase
MSFRMPAEWEPHERTLMGWPCRPSSWGETLTRGREEFAAVANAISAFEPVTMVCATEADAAEARRHLSGGVEIAVRPMDGSWLRDNGPIFVTDGRTRAARHFRFNAWAERHASRDRDAALGRTLARSLGDEVLPVDVVLEGGAIAVDGAGTLVTTEGCVMHPGRNWEITRDEVETRLRAALGVSQVIWLPQGLEQDLDRAYGTDGHIDLFMDFVAEKRCLMLSVPDDDVNAEHLAQSRAMLRDAGIEVIDFPYMSGFRAGDRHVIAPYLNFYVCNGGVLVPVAGAEPDMDAEALASIARHWPGREVVGIPMRAAPMQGGAIHCMTQQVPMRP